MNTTVQGQRPPRKLAVFFSLWVVAASTGWTTNGGQLLNVVFGGLALIMLALTMVKETRTLRLRGMTVAAALWYICWFAVVGFVSLFLFWLEVSDWLFGWPPLGG